MRTRVLLVAIVIATVVVGIAAGWVYALGVPLIAALGFSVLHVLGVEMEATSRWSSALYGNDQEDANHWSRTGVGGKRKR
jgi:hypothetical protein